MQRDGSPPVTHDRIIRIAHFRAALRAFLARSEAVSRAWRLTPQRYLLLLTIKGAPDGSERVTFSELAERLKLSPNTVTELVARAEGDGLVRRERSSGDRRVTYLRLTEEGERRLLGAVTESEEDRRRLAQDLEDLRELYLGSDSDLRPE